MTITSKFNGRCKACGGAIPAGARIDWTREGGAKHLTVNECAAARAAANARPTAPAVRANGAPIAAFIRAARERGLKFPKARFLAPDGHGELLLTLAKDTGFNPGAVYVKLNGDYIGKIMADGTVGGELAQRADILATLNVVAENPAEAAKAYGKLTGRCSFCDARLTDDRSGSSVEVGYGPICAKRYGLPHAPRGRSRTELLPVRPVSGATMLDIARSLEGVTADELFAEAFEEAK